MKQGSASRDGRYGGKVEPRAHAINPGGVSQLGNHVGNHVSERRQTADKAIEPMYKGRGFEAPHDAGNKVHRSGSQGRR